MPEPCSYCNVRSDIGCRHRPAEGEAPIAIVTSSKVDGRTLKKDLNQGLHFKLAKVRKLKGNKGNPSLKQFKRALQGKTKGQR